jgi:hypothetical protein
MHGLRCWTEQADRAGTGSTVHDVRVGPVARDWIRDSEASPLGGSGRRSQSPFFNKLLVLVVVLVFRGFGLSGGRLCFRLFFAAVTGVAGDMHFAVGEVGIDLLSHNDHLAGNLFVRVVVAGEIAFDVAEVALNAESSAEGAHDGH